MINFRENKYQRHFLIICILSIIITLIVEFNLTSAIFFGGYLDTKDMILDGNNDTYYLFLINESSKGNWNLGNPFSKEWSGAAYLYPSLNINAPGLLKRIFHLDVKSTSIIISYGSLFILMALILTFFLLLFGRNYFGYLVGIAFIFYSPSYSAYTWGRIVSPQINFIPLILFFIFYFSNFKFWKRELGLAILAGILFYTYPYHWTFALPMLVIGDLWTFVRHKKIIREYLYKYIAIVVISLPYILHFLQIHNLSYYEESMRRIGLLYSRWPAGIYTQLGLLSCLALFFILQRYVFSRFKFNISTFVKFDKVIIGFIVSLIVLNQQLITGKQLEFNSHYLPVIIIFFAAFFGGLVFVAMNTLRRHAKIFIIASILLTLILASNYTMFQIKYKGFAIKNNYFGSDALSVADWFVKNNIKGEVIYTPLHLNNAIGLLTNNYLYFHQGQELQLMPTAEIVDRFIYFDITNNLITEYPENYQGQLFGHTYDSIMQKENVINRMKSLLLRKPFVSMPLSQYIKFDFGLIREKRKTVSIDEFNKYLDKYHVDYLLYEQKDRHSIYEKVPGKVVFENQAYLIKKRPEV